MATTEFCKRFEVPEAALAVIDQIVNRQEMQLIEALEQDRFTASEAHQALQAASGEPWPMERVDALLQTAYQRGIVQYEDETLTRYKVGSFYSRLDIFAISEPEAYRALPRQTQIALDQWYFAAYLGRLAPGVAAPTGDQIVPLAQAMEHLDSVRGPIWLNRCDCRTLAGNCDLPTQVCISFRNGINTFSHRGWSAPLTKEQAKAVLERADRAGLIHTVNPGGICNCCGDCCYLFRAERARDSQPAWPARPWIAAFRPEACRNCGLCIKRCHFGAFERVAGTVQYYPDRCRGCGLCRETCPAGAIDIVKRRSA